MRVVQNALLFLLATLSASFAYDTFNVTYNSNNISYTYNDTGPPLRANESYPTIFMIHGFIFHSGTFQKLSDVNDDVGLRLIYINRRGYQGSTPYNDSEVVILNNGTDDEQAQFINTEGAYLALLVDGLSHALNITGPTSVLGWSLGTIFAMAFMTSATSDIDDAVKKPTSNLLGIASPPGAFFPDFTQGISSINGFYDWLTSYYTHDDLSTRNISVLDQNTPDPSRPGTLQRMTGMNLLNISEIAAGPARTETPLATGENGVLESLGELVNRTILDPDLSTHWPNIATNWVMYGDSTFYTVSYGAWGVEDRAKAILDAGDNPKLAFLALPFANHFVAWDFPILLADALAITQNFSSSSSS